MITEKRRMLTVEKDLSNIVVAKEGEGEFQPRDEIGFSCDVLRDEKRAFIGVVADEEVLSVHLLLKKLRARYLLDKYIIRDRQETPSSEVAVSADVETSILQSCGVLVDPTFKDSARRRSIGSIGHATSMGRKSIVRLRRHPVFVSILHRQVRRSRDGVLEQGSSQSTTISHGLQHDRTTSS